MRWAKKVDAQNHIRLRIGESPIPWLWRECSLQKAGLAATNMVCVLQYHTVESTRVTFYDIERSIGEWGRTQFDGLAMISLVS